MRYLGVEVPGFALTQPQELLALLEIDLYRPSGGIDLVGLRKGQVDVGGKKAVPFPREGRSPARRGSSRRGRP